MDCMPENQNLSTKKRQCGLFQRRRLDLWTDSCFLIIPALINGNVPESRNLNYLQSRNTTNLGAWQILLALCNTNLSFGRIRNPSSVQRRANAANICLCYHKCISMWLPQCWYQRQKGQTTNNWEITRNFERERVSQFEAAFFEVLFYICKLIFLYLLCYKMANQ